MGEIADMMISGFLDMETGEVIDGDAPGYPRTKQKRRNRSKKKGTHKCSECTRSFRTEQGLNDHRRDSHGIKEPTP